MYMILLGIFLLLVSILVSIYFAIRSKVSSNASYWYLIIMSIFIVIGSLLFIFIQPSNVIIVKANMEVGNSHDLASIFNKY